MRITQRMIVENSLKYINENQESIAYLERKISSGKEIGVASDNPNIAVASLTLRSSLKMNDAYLATMSASDNWMAATEKGLADIVELAKRTLDLSSASLSDTQGANERLITSREIAAILDQGIEIGNTNLSGSYIFAGFQVDTAPFTYTPPPAPPPPALGTVTYNGDMNNIVRSVGPGHNLTINIDGNTTFFALFDSMDRIRVALENNDTVALRTAIDTNLRPALDRIIMTRTTTGARQRDLQSIIDRTEKTQIQMKNLISKREDTKIADAVTELRLYENSYQAVLEVNRRALSTLNLFDYLK
jgi:flagellar hook-associated protein 3 FlgL